MKYRYFIALCVLFTTGCDKADKTPSVAVSSSSPAAVSQKAASEALTLGEARRQFATKLIRHESAATPFPKPPADVFAAIQYESEVGKLGAYLSPDPKDRQKHPAVVWITGGDCSTIDDSLWQIHPDENDQTARQFREAGIILMFPTQRGGNQNPGFHEGFYGEVDDILAAAIFLAKQPYVDPQRIYLGGHSSGATMALLTAECSSRFRAVFAIGPTDDLRHYPHDFDGLFQPFDISNPREFELRAPGLWLSSIKVPVFIMAGTVGDGALPAVNNMEAACKNPLVHFARAADASHWSILAPTNRLLAQKILLDSGPSCNLTLTSQELSQPFTK